jgi:hypothetical protein
MFMRGSTTKTCVARRNLTTLSISRLDVHPISFKHVVMTNSIISLHLLMPRVYNIYGYFILYIM